jgi:two-component system, LytTR family, response regulator
MSKMTAIIVDDEKPARKNLMAILQEYFTFLQVVGEASNAQEAKIAIQASNPDIVFLDIELGLDNGLSLLNSFSQPKFQTIFVTAYDSYAVKAFRANATDYILKPIDISQLEEAILKVKDKLTLAKEKIEPSVAPLETMSNSGFVKVSTQDGSELLHTDDIIYLKSVNYYSILMCRNGKEIISSKTLKEYEVILESFNFYRVHNSYLINVKHLTSVESKESHYAILSDETKITVSRRRKEDFLQYVSGIKGR